MITMPDLETALRDLLYELREAKLGLIMGGGYGIYLKVSHVIQSDAQTLLKEWPEPRSTNDLDFFLRPELLIDSDKLIPLRQALDYLGYRVVKGAENYQFAMSGPKSRTGSIKIDLLTGPQKVFSGTNVTTDSRRAKPYSSVGLHAHPVDEAISLEMNPIPIKITNQTSTGKTWHAEIQIPHPFTFAMMKLYAFRDQFKNADNDFGRHHALDIYTILATTTEQEWEQAVAMSNQLQSLSEFEEARNIVAKNFSTSDSMGIIRLKESPYFQPEIQIDDFILALRELFFIT